MLVKILKMPPAMGVPLNRQLAVSLNGAGGHADIRWSHFHSFKDRFSVGFPLRTLPGPLFKAVYVTNSNHVFEAVFSEQNGRYLCWYTKIISWFDISVGVSLNAVKFLTSGNYPVIPTAYLFAPPLQPAGIDWVVPVVMGERSLWSFGQRVRADATGGSDKPLGFMFRPLLLEEPQLLQALVSGWFSFDPFHAPSAHQPHVHLYQDQWFGFQEAFHAAKVKGMHCEINHREFDELTQMCIQLRQTKFSVTALLSSAIDRLSSTTWVTRDYVDSYWMLFGHQETQTTFQNDLDAIFHLAAMAYCKMFQVDPDAFGSQGLGRNADYSSLTITKTMSDEVSFTFHDLVHDRHVCFYCFYPLLAMSTLAAGSEVP